MKKTLPLLSMLLLTSLVLGACGAQSESAIATAVALTVQAQNALATSTPEPRSTPAADITVAPTLTNIFTPIPPTSLPGGKTGVECAKASLVNETIPDGTIMKPETTFFKSWTIKNESLCTWDTNYKVVFWDGNTLGGAYIYNLPLVTAPGQTINDTWEYDGTNWQQVNVGLPAPPASSGNRAVFDAARRRVVMWSVSDARVWEWDGVAWVVRQTQTNLSFRGIPGLAYDDRSGRTVLFGGWVDRQTRRRDTWEYGPDAGASAFGQACQGEGLSSLGPPVIGAPMTLGLSAPPTTIGFAWLGLSDQTWIGPLPHPFPAPGTRPGCDAFVSFDLLLTAIGGGGTYTLPLPRDPNLAGATLLLQAFGVAPNLSFTTTNALRLRIGGL